MEDIYSIAFPALKKASSCVTLLDHVLVFPVAATNSWLKAVLIIDYKARREQQTSFVQVKGNPPFTLFCVWDCACFFVLLTARLLLSDYLCVCCMCTWIREAINKREKIIVRIAQMTIPVLCWFHFGDWAQDEQGRVPWHLLSLYTMFSPLVKDGNEVGVRKKNRLREKCVTHE